MSRVPTRERVQKHRDQLRARGMLPIQIWVPDVTAPGFAEEAGRQARVVASSSNAADDQAFVDSISDWDD